MRIALVHSFYSSQQPSGENVAVLAQKSALEDAGHEVLLVEKHNDVEMAKTGYSLRSALSVVAQVGPDPSHALARFGPDVVHVHNLFPNWSGRFLTTWGSRSVATLHNYRTVCASATLFRDGHDCTACLDSGSQMAVRYACCYGSRLKSLPLAVASRGRGHRQPVLNRVRHLIALNAGAAAGFAAWAPDAVVHCIPNFVPANRCHVPFRDRAGFVYAGRLTAEKGVGRLVHDWPETVPLTVVGSGPMLNELRDIARAREQVRVAGLMSAAGTARLIARAEGLVIPSLWREGIPTVALEALAAGTPLILSEHCSAATELLRGAGGVQYRPRGGAAELAQAMEAVRSGGEPMSLSARAAHRDRYSSESWLRAITPVYERIAGSPDPIGSLSRVHGAARERPDSVVRSDQSGLIIFEPNGHGHRYWYCHLLAAHALREGLSVTLLTSSKWLDSAEFRLHLAGPDLIGLRIQPFEPTRGPASVVNSLDIIRALRGAAASKARVIVPEADKALPVLALWPLPLKKHMAGALIMRAPTGLRGIFKRLLMGAAARRINLRALVPSTDDRNGHFVADPVVTKTENTNAVTPFRRLRIGVGGVIDERKRIDGLLTLAENRDIDLVLAGRLSESIRVRVAGLIESGAGLVAPDRLLEDSELDELLRTADVVSVMLATSVGSSGILARAVALGKPVLACGNETVEREVSRLGIGVLARSPEPDDVRAALDGLRSRWPVCAAQIAAAQRHLGSSENFYRRLSGAGKAMVASERSTGGG